MEIRLQKFLAECGVASRRKSEELILNGEIILNGEVVTELGTKIDSENDVVVYDGKRIFRKEKMIYVALFKPEGYITTVTDQFERKTVLDLITDIKERIYPIGRLDYDTSGLIILTNDGDLTYKLTHPKHNITKTYIAKIKGQPTESELSNFRNGLLIEDEYKTAKADIKVVRTDRETSIVEIIIGEGRNRQVRKMCEAIGHEVIKLKRVATGKLTLGNLKRGEYRHLTDEEIKYLKNL